MIHVRIASFHKDIQQVSPFSKDVIDSIGQNYEKALKRLYALGTQKVELIAKITTDYASFLKSSNFTGDY
jgi:hypothetical protein